MTDTERKNHTVLGIKPILPEQGRPKVELPRDWGIKDELVEDWKDQDAVIRAPGAGITTTNQLQQALEATSILCPQILSPSMYSGRPFVYGLVPSPVLLSQLLPPFLQPY